MDPEPESICFADLTEAERREIERLEAPQGEPDEE